MEIWGIAAKARSRSAKEEGVLLWERGNFCGSKNFFFSAALVECEYEPPACLVAAPPIHYYSRKGGGCKKERRVRIDKGKYDVFEV